MDSNILQYIGNQHLGGGTPLRGNYAGIGYEWDEDNNIFWPKKPYASWVKHIESATWKSPIGDAPALTAEQTSQNEAGTHRWYYVWNESAYQADNTALGLDRPNGTIYIWWWYAKESINRASVILR